MACNGALAVNYARKGQWGKAAGSVVGMAPDFTHLCRVELADMLLTCGFACGGDAKGSLRPLDFSLNRRVLDLEDDYVSRQPNGPLHIVGMAVAAIATHKEAKTTDRPGYDGRRC